MYIIMIWPHRFLCVAVIQTHFVPFQRANIRPSRLVHRILTLFVSRCIISQCTQYLQQFVCHNYPCYVSWYGSHGNTWVATLALVTMNYLQLPQEDTTLVWYLKAVHTGITILNGCYGISRVLTVCPALMTTTATTVLSMSRLQYRLWWHMCV